MPLEVLWSEGCFKHPGIEQQLIVVTTQSNIQSASTNMYAKACVEFIPTKVPPKIFALKNEVMRCVSVTDSSYMHMKNDRSRIFDDWLWRGFTFTWHQARHQGRHQGHVSCFTWHHVSCKIPRALQTDVDPFSLPVLACCLIPCKCCTLLNTGDENAKLSIVVRRHQKGSDM